MTAPQRLAQALQDARTRDADQHSVQATVTAVQAATATVSINGVESTWPFLANYTPQVGDTVWCVGPPGSWVIIGSVSGVGPARATSVSSTGPVTAPSVTATQLASEGYGVQAASALFGGTSAINGGGFSGNGANLGGNVLSAGGISSPGKNISTDPNGSMNSYQISCANLTYGTLTPASDAQLKDVVADEVDDQLVDALLDAPVGTWTWRPQIVQATDGDGQLVEFDARPDTAAHVGMLAQHAPQALRSVRPDGYLGYDLTGVVGVLQAAVRRERHARRQVELRLDRLEAKLDARDG